MMMNKKWWLVGIGILAGMMIGQGIAAATLKGENLIVKPLTDNQNSQYRDDIYRFRYEANREYIVEANIINTGTEARQYQADISDVFTNQNGQFVYRDVANRQGVRNLTKVSHQSGTIYPQEVKRISFKLKTGEEPFNGVKLGGLRVTELAQSSQNDIKNNISLITSIVIATSEVETTALDKIDLTNVTSVFTTTKRGYQFKFQNDTEQLLNGAEAELRLFKKDKKIDEKKIQSISIAPGAPFELFWSIGGQPVSFTRATVTFKKDDQTKTVSFNHAEASPTVINMTQKNDRTPYYLGGGLIVVTLAVGGHFVMKRRRLNDET